MAQNSTGQCSVKYCCQHYGHDNVEDLPKQSLSVEFRDEVAKRLYMGVAPQAILLQLREEAYLDYEKGTHWPRHCPPH